MSSPLRFLAFDTETTGFRSDARIVEIGCVLFDDGEPVERWSSLIHPVGIDWEDANVKKALEVNKLAAAEIETGPTFDKIVDELLAAFSSAGIWVAHNAEFDLRMLSQEFQRLGHPRIPLEPARGVRCTLALSRALHPRERGHKLSEAAARWGIVPDGLHRASSDALTCGRILNAMGELPTDIGWIHEQRPQEQSGRVWG